MVKKFPTYTYYCVHVYVGIFQAFRQLEQVDNSLDVPPAQSSILSSLMTSLEAQQQTQQAETTNPMLLQALQAQPPVPVTISASPPQASTSPERLSVQTVPAASAASEPTTSQAQDAGVNVSEAAAVPSTTTAQASLPRYENNAGGRPIRSLRTPMKEITTLDRPEELDEFMEQGEEACIADMKQFITQYSLRQTTVAMMTGEHLTYLQALMTLKMGMEFEARKSKKMLRLLIVKSSSVLWP
ncbi:unnamed protein product [Strongylus vulgaris]|uniref:POU-specific atypical domain-containing protein n=1 Tax=Strongylus vulgaris TaxID=40348 RepID=A0A3P7IV25_STRVU|nr:unnamed protein product [Strongylus vulgaris]